MWRSIVACLPHDPGCPSNHRARSDRETGAPRPAPRFCSAKQRPTGHSPSPRERESRARISRAEILLSQRGPRQHPVDAPGPIRVRCSRPTSLRPLPPPSCGRGGADAAAAAGGRHVVAAGGPCGQVGPLDGGVIWSTAPYALAPAVLLCGRRAALTWHAMPLGVGCLRGVSRRGVAVCFAFLFLVRGLRANGHGDGDPVGNTCLRLRLRGASFFGGKAVGCGSVRRRRWGGMEL
jgi:ribosomal protein L27